MKVLSPGLLILIVVLVSTSLLLVLGMLHQVRKRNAALAEGDDRPRPTLACPLCRTEMAPGYVMAGRGIHWRDAAQRPVGTFATIFGALPNTLSASLPPRENRAWRCGGCSVVTIDHSALVRLR